MEKRFGAAVLTAVLLHAALIGFTVLRRHSEAPRLLERGLVASTTEVDLFMLTPDDGPSSAHSDSDSTPSTQQPSDRKGPAQARVTRLGAPSPSEPAPAADAELDQGAPPPDAALAELGPGAEAESSSDGSSEAEGRARQRVNLGLDGSVMRQATLEARERGPSATPTRRRRPVFSLSHWSETVVRSLAQKSAPPDGKALLTLEWDAKGQLLSVTSSAASSRKEEWQRLAQGLGSQLAARPNASAQGRGLRLVYLVKSDLTSPDPKRSSSPAAKFASAEQLRVDNLPPASAIYFGVKADGSAAKTRVVSVELVRSDAL